jgi:two-component system, NarL family, invasion response regulator UvrY
MIGILIVDDHDIVRTGIKLILGGDPNFQVLGEASDGDQVLALARKLKPQVVLMDLHMPRMSGIEATEKLRQALPKIGVIILTMQGSTTLPRRLLSNGARGYLSKGCPAHELLAAVRTVAAGRAYVGADIAQQMAQALLPGADQSPFEALSPREIEVALALARGQRAAAIAEQLHLSAKTVATYKYRLYEKLGIDNDVELLKLAQQHGLIDAPMVL